MSRVFLEWRGRQREREDRGEESREEKKTWREWLIVRQEGWKGMTWGRRRREGEDRGEESKEEKMEETTDSKGRRGGWLEGDEKEMEGERLCEAEEGGRG